MSPSREPHRRGVFAYSRLDLYLALVTLCGLSLLSLSVWEFHRWPAAALALLWLLQAAVICSNYQCVAHNFVHNEFFRARGANTAFSILNSVALGFSQSVFREHHLNHHRYNNRPPLAGREGDLSSLSRFSGNPDIPEGLLRYSLLSPLRADVILYGREAVRHGRALRLALDMAAIAAVMAAMAEYSWRYLAFYYVPLLYFGHVLTYAEGHFEHYRAEPGDRLRNAVSCYGKFYNWVWFNNGYHQEHHCYPKLHWTRIAVMRQRMLPERERRVVRYAHFTNCGRNPAGRRLFS